MSDCKKHRWGHIGGPFARRGSSQPRQDLSTDAKAISGSCDDDDHDDDGDDDADDADADDSYEIDNLNDII